jgi:hypothetical protein
MLPARSRLTCPAGEFFDRESIYLKSFNFAGLSGIFRPTFGFISSGILLTYLERRCFRMNTGQDI